MNKEEEIWQDVQGFPNYQISDLGRIKVKKYSKNNRIFKEKLLKPQKNKKSGYIQIMLTDDKNQRKLKYLHRLVANAFLPKDEITTVRHKDGDKANNKASNLEYGKPNTRHKTEVDRKRFKYLIKQKLLNDAIIAVYNGFDELIKNGYKKVSIVAASNCNYINGNKGRVDIYKGYKWDVIRMKKEEKNND